ncbi:unnamed protein product [Closterium sp. NIES-54]
MDLLCPVSTSTAFAINEQPEIRAYKLGKQKCSYNQVELVFLNEDSRSSKAELSLTEAIEVPIGSEVDTFLHEGTLKYNLRFQDDRRMRLYVFLVFANHHGATFKTQAEYHWVPVVRSQCTKGCIGPILKGLQRFGRLSRRSVVASPDDPDVWKEPRHLYIAIDEASTHIRPCCNTSKFRLLFAFYSESQQFLGSSISSSIKVVANNDAPQGAANLQVNCFLQGLSAFDVRASGRDRPPFKALLPKTPRFHPNVPDTRPLTSEVPICSPLLGAQTALPLTPGSGINHSDFHHRQGRAYLPPFSPVPFPTAAITGTPQQHRPEEKRCAEFDNQEDYITKEHSLGALTLSVVGACLMKEGGKLNLEELENLLGIRRRKLYDIFNVLECISIVKKQGKIEYLWLGSDGIGEALGRIKGNVIAGGEGSMSVGVTSLQGSNAFYEKSSPGTADPQCYGSGKDSEDNPDTRRGSNLRNLGEKFVQLFLQGTNATIPWEDAAEMLLDSPDDRSLIWRLYDVVNILSSINLIEKVQEAPAIEQPHSTIPKSHYRWIGVNGPQQCFEGIIKASESATNRFQRPSATSEPALKTGITPAKRDRELPSITWRVVQAPLRMPSAEVQEAFTARSGISISTPGSAQPQSHTPRTTQQLHQQSPVSSNIQSLQRQQQGKQLQTPAKLMGVGKNVLEPSGHKRSAQKKQQALRPRHTTEPDREPPSPAEPLMRNIGGTLRLRITDGVAVSDEAGRRLLTGEDGEASVPPSTLAGARRNEPSGKLVSLTSFMQNSAGGPSQTSAQEAREACPDSLSQQEAAPSPGVRQGVSSPSKRLRLSFQPVLPTSATQSADAQASELGLDLLRPVARRPIEADVNAQGGVVPTFGAEGGHVQSLPMPLGLGTAPEEDSAMAVAAAAAAAAVAAAASTGGGTFPRPAMPGMPQAFSGPPSASLPLFRPGLFQGAPLGVPPLGGIPEGASMPTGLMPGGNPPSIDPLLWLPQLFSPSQLAVMQFQNPGFMNYYLEYSRTLFSLYQPGSGNASSPPFPPSTILTALPPSVTPPLQPPLPAAIHPSYLHPSPSAPFPPRPPPVHIPMHTAAPMGYQFLLPPTTQSAATATPVEAEAQASLPAPSTPNLVPSGSPLKPSQLKLSLSNEALTSRDSAGPLFQATTTSSVATDPKSEVSTTTTS